MMKADFLIRPFEETDLDAFRQIVQKYWSERHIFLKSTALLQWQYHGYGPFEGMHFPLLLYKNKIIGFRGLIPAELRVSDCSAVTLRPVVVSAMFLVIPEWRRQKLGLALQRYTLEKYHNYFAIASNLQTSAPMHRKTGCYVLDKMLRYLLPLSEQYENLLLNADVGWREFLYRPCEDRGIGPVDMSSEELALFWQHSVEERNITAFNRSSSFWEWRYKLSPIYRYLFFGGQGTGGVVVGRICTLYNDDLTVRPEKVFRILELIPEHGDVWEGYYCTQLESLIKGVSQWAYNEGCTAIEFYTTTNLFAKILIAAGLREVNYDDNNKDMEIISYFEPCSSVARLSNVSLYLEHYQGQFDYNSSYFTLSDADQDRPNILI